MRRNLYYEMQICFHIFLVKERNVKNEYFYDFIFHI